MGREEAKRGHVVVMRATDPDCLTGRPWGTDRCKQAVEMFNTALGLERPQYLLTYENGMVQVVVDDDEAHLDHAFKLGISSGLGQAAGTLLNGAAEKFREGSDKEAKLLRSLSEMLKDTGKKAHPGRAL